MLKIVVALVLLAHGVGHSMGLLQLFNVATVNPSWRGDSWLLTGPFGSGVTQAAGVLLWSASIIGFGAVAAAVVGWLPISWFTPLAVASSFTSLLGIVLFPMAFPTTSTIGAIVVDVVLLAAATWFRWLPTEIGA